MNRRVVLSGMVVLTIIFGIRGLSAAENPGDMALPVQLGAEYEVVGELYVHEVTTNLNKRTVDYMVLVPLRLTGPEILSRRLVTQGSRIRIVAKREQRWLAFFQPVEYAVELDSISRATEVPVILGLSRGNEGRSGSLNPSIYRRLTSAKRPE